MPPPKPAVLPLTVLFVNVSVEVTPLTMPPPAAPPAAVLPLTVLSTTFTAPVLSFAMPPPLSAMLPLEIVRPEIVTTKAPEAM